MRANFSKLTSLSICLVAFLSLVATVENSKAEDLKSLKKLFYTSSERKKIDFNRFKTIKKTNGEYRHKDDPGNGSLKNGSKSKEVLETVSIQGFIKREDGKNVVWYNNTNTLSSNVDSAIKLKPASIVNNRISIVSNRKKIRMKPGQVLQLTTGKIQEQYKLRDSSAKMKIEKQ